MNILEKIGEYAKNHPDRPVIISGQERMTWGELWQYSDRLAGWLLANEEPSVPIAVYGHKHPYMLAAFLGCVKSGHAYCPIDISVPDERVKMILDALPSSLILTTETVAVSGKEAVDTQMLQQIFEDEYLEVPHQEAWVRGEDIYYMIFTSGSTGTPKGVQITADCLGHYLDWSVGLGSTAKRKQGQIFLNQAPFSFDLSVMDLYTCLASGGTLYCLTKKEQGDYTLLMQALGKSEANVWVSTPSFADVCLSDPKFNCELLPNLEVFLFCGETLGNRTARKLMERFPDAVVINTYGPTESTVAVTDVLITREMAQGADALPVGRAKPGTWIQIWDSDGNCLPEGEKGEIVILGDTVSPGYYQKKELTEKAFFQTDKIKEAFGSNPTTVRGYHTGDEGYLKDGMLYYSGRIDLQIKLHGYRIELEDIENNLRRLPEIAHVVVIPNQRGGKVSSLTAFVVSGEEQEGSATGKIPEDTKVASAELKEKLAAFLPSYMIPKKFVFLEQMPMTNNGKADRKQLGGRV